MIFISHRANLTGPKSAYFGENHPDSIRAALQAGFHLEIDIWYDDVQNSFALGHDGPNYPIGIDFLSNDRFWVHCKNIEALYRLKDHVLLNCFYHTNEDVVLTTKGILWHYPRKTKLTQRSIQVLPELVSDISVQNILGVCTDYPIEFKKDLNFKMK